MEGDVDSALKGSAREPETGELMARSRVVGLMGNSED